MKRVLYTGAFRLPDGDAAAWRVRGVARLLRRSGAELTFAGWESAGEQATYVMDGDVCHPQGEFRESKIGPFRRLWGFVTRGEKTLEWIRQQPPFQAIVVYNPPALFAWRLLRECRRSGCRLIVDSTEWYQGSHLPGGRFGLASLENWVRMRLVYPRFENVICISRFLANHFRGRNVVNIPPLKDERTATPAGSDTRPDIRREVRFVYAGQAGRKDLLAPFIDALPGLSRSLGRPVRLRIAGMTRPELVDVLRDNGVGVDALDEHVECLGRRPRDEVMQLYRDSHFSVIFRENQRYAIAGFPTKAVESWSQGCPIICNPVGDLGSLAEPMVDAILVDKSSIGEPLARALRDIIDAGTHPVLSVHSREKAARLFSAEAHSETFANFIGKAMQ